MPQKKPGKRTRVPNSQKIRKPGSQPRPRNINSLSKQIDLQLRLSKDILPKPLSNREMFMLGVIDAFDPRVRGVKGPDNWGDVSTDTFCIELDGTFTTNASGNGDFMCLPSATLTVLSILGASSISTTPGMQYTAAGSTDCVFGAFPVGSLSSEYSAVRPIVGAVRIGSNNNFSNVQGRVFGSAWPATIGSTVNQDMLTTMAGTSPTSVVCKDLFGFGSLTTITNSGGRTGAQKINTAQLFDSDLLLRMIPCGPGAHHWRNVVATEITDNGYTLTSNAMASALGVVTTNQRDGSADCQDFECPSISLKGLSASTSINFSYICHFEGRRTTASTALLANMAGSNAHDSSLTTDMVEKICRGIRLVGMAAPQVARAIGAIGGSLRSAGFLAGAAAL